MSDTTFVKKLKVVELKAALSERGINTKGKKDELIKRLLEAMAADEQSNDQEEAVQSEPEVAEEAKEESSEEPSHSNEQPPDRNASGGGEIIEKAQEEAKDSEEPTAEPIPEPEGNIINLHYIASFIILQV